MTSVFQQSLRQNFDYALTQLAETIEGCPADRWDVDLWGDEAPTTTTDYGAIRGSSPWLLALHALICLDYDLAGEFDRWSPPAPIGGSLVGPDPTRLVGRDEMLGYLNHCRLRVETVLAGLTDALAERPLPDTHRYRGTRYGVVIGTIPTHVVEHATQIRQFYR